MTEKELEQLIDEIESEPLLKAPAGLKENILNKADKMDARKELSMKIKKRGELILYSLEVAAVTAAAVVLILMSPLKDGFNIRPEEKEATLFIKEETLSESFFDKAHKIAYFGDFMDNFDTKQDTKEEQ